MDPVSNLRFRVVGDRLLDARGTVFAMRGINHPHAWFPERLDEALDAIAGTGSNAVRVVLSSGGRWRRTGAAELARVLDACRDRRLVAIPEIHDATGWGEDPAARPLREVLDWWTSREILDVLAGREGEAILNVANEPTGNGVSLDQWTSEHVEAVGRMRAAGLSHVLMVDGPDWGQDRGRGMLGRTERILAADPARDVLFAVHMYEQYGTEERVRSYLDSFAGRCCLVVGEFAADHGPHGDVDEDAVLRWTRATGQGCLAWSWKGNAAPVEGLDIASSWDGALTPWGRRLVEGPDGLRTTARSASIFPGPARL